VIAAARADGRPLDLAALEADLLADDDTETTLVVGHWQYVSSGWPRKANGSSPSLPPPALANTTSGKPNNARQTSRR
jgi:hypothetical protein